MKTQNKTTAQEQNQKQNTTTSLLRPILTMLAAGSLSLVAFGTVGCESWNDKYMNDTEAERHESWDKSPELKRFTEAVTPDAYKGKDTVLESLEERLENAESKLDTMAANTDAKANKLANKLEKRVDMIGDKIAEAKKDTQKEWRKMSDEVSDEIDEIESDIRNL